MIKCGKGKNDLQWMLQKTAKTFCDMVNVHVFNIGNICIHGKESLRQLAFHQEYKRSHNDTNVRHICEIIFLKILHGSICLWLVMNKSSVFCAQKSTSFQILYCVLVRYTRTPNQTLHGNEDWSDSKLHQSTELWTELMVSQWNSSGISSQHSTRCSSVKKFKSYCWDQMKHQRILQEGSSSCRCSTTSHRDQETTWINASQMFNSFLYLQKDSEQDNGHSSVLVQRKSGILSVKMVHKVNGTKWRKRWWWHSQQVDIQSFEPQAHCPEVSSRAKVVENCRSTIVPTRTRSQLFSHNYFCKSAQSLRSSRRNVWRMWIFSS